MPLKRNVLRICFLLSLFVFMSTFKKCILALMCYALRGAGGGGGMEVCYQGYRLFSDTHTLLYIKANI